MNLADQPARTITKDMQTKSNRNKPKRSKRTQFSARVRQNIIERDKGLCVRCKQRYCNIHHITFASQGGLGIETNGVCVCFRCHEWAHSGKVGREWFERYRERNLL